MKKANFVVLILVCLMCTSCSSFYKSGSGIPWALAYESTRRDEIGRIIIKANKKYDRGNYRGSIPLYEKALKNETFIAKNGWWYVITDRLSMAYGATGNLEAAEGTIRYGLSKDSEYPYFYFILACVYYVKRDMDNCIDNIELALKYKDNILKGGTLDNPKDFFIEFWKDDEFASKVENLMKQYEYSNE